MSRLPRFLVTTPLIRPGKYELDKSESHHAAHVLRLRQGDAAEVFDGVGHSGQAVVEHVGKHEVIVSVATIASHDRLSPQLTVATAIPKGKRWQTLVEKCTELGVDVIQPILCERSVAKGEGDAGKWQQWSIAAAKQSYRNWLPKVEEPQALPGIVDMAVRDGTEVYVADAEGRPLWRNDANIRPMTNLLVVVGPEGGLTDMEQAFLASRGAVRIRLSPFILRVETAAMAVCTLIREGGR